MQLLAVEPATMSRKLIVLDINGVLCTKTQDNVEKNEGIKLATYNVIFRPEYRKFLNFCYENYDVGFFSSTTYKNASLILKKLLTPEQYKKTVFMWFRDRTVLDPDFNKDPEIKQFDTIKRLSDIIDNPIVNHDRRYNYQNTVLIDDSQRKTRFNDPFNIVIVPPYDGSKEDDILESIMEEILIKF